MKTTLFTRWKENGVYYELEKVVDLSIVPPIGAMIWFSKYGFGDVKHVFVHLPECGEESLTLQMEGVGFQEDDSIQRNMNTYLDHGWVVKKVIP